MKLFNSTLLMMAGMLFFGTANAQQCATIDTRCTTNNTLNQPGFEHPDSLPCIIQGEAYDQSIQLLMFSDFNIGASVQVDSVQFTSISNLPCGLCWSSNKANNKFYPNERGCIRFTGTTTDDTGQYKLPITLKAWINPNPNPIETNSGLVDAAGIKLYLRIGGNCAPSDTTSGTYSNTASCATAINGIGKDISVLAVMPNPVNGNATVSFNAANSGAYTMTVTNITGKMVQSQRIDVTAGFNKIAIDRQQLQAGMYFLGISNGNSSITRKFVVAD